MEIDSGRGPLYGKKGLGNLFAVSALTIGQIGMIAGLAFIPTALIQLFRIVRR